MNFIATRFLIILLMFSLNDILCKPLDSNICQMSSEFQLQGANSTSVEEYIERRTMWCWNIPPRCSVYLKVHKNHQKIRNNSKKFTSNCCVGYRRHPLGGHGCVPDCLEICQNGSCASSMNPDCVAVTLQKEASINGILIVTLLGFMCIVCGVAVLYVGQYFNIIK